jgi:hypothetical protein
MIPWYNVAGAGLPFSSGMPRQQSLSRNISCCPRVSQVPGAEEDKVAVYNFIELVGTSSESWEKAAAVAVETASKTLRDLRVAEVLEMDVTIEQGKVALYRTKLRLSFKYEGS